jgi:hypothetical protein
LHQQVKIFVHDYGNITWGMKWLEGYPLLFWFFFFGQIISITLQKIQTSSILTQEVAIGLATFELTPFQDLPPIPTIDLLQVGNQQGNLIFFLFMKFNSFAILIGP